MSFTQTMSHPPSLTLASGSGGLHGIWILKKPIAIVDKTTRSQAAALLTGFQAWINEQGAKSGYQHFDNMSALGQVHRAPFSLNMKAGVKNLCQPLQITDTVYELEEILSLCRSVVAASQRSSATAPPRSTDELNKLLSQTDTEWLRQRKDRRNEFQANPAAVLESCKFLQHSVEKAALLSEPDWHHTISVMARTFEGAKIVHEMSRPHPGYSATETDRKIDRVLAEAGPTRCETIAQTFDGCQTCLYRGKITTPLTNPVDEFERKGIDAESRPTPRGILLISNHKTAVNLPPDDQRFSVITAPSERNSAPNYYKLLFDFSPQTLASIYWYLMNFDLSDFDAKGDAIRTLAKDKMIESSVPEINAVVRDMIENRNPPFGANIFRPIEVEKSLRERLPNSRCGPKLVRRVLEECGAIADPQKRPCRFKDADGKKCREVLWFLADKDPYPEYEPAQLAALFEGRLPEED